MSIFGEKEMILMQRLKTLLLAIIIMTSALVPVLPAKAEGNLLPNPSVESESAPGNPTGWTANKWGTNVATLTHENQGHTGSKSLKVAMSSYTDGDAKWMHTPVGVAPNTSYTYSSFYKSDVGTEIDLQYTDTSGNISYAFAKWLPASSDWQELSTEFTTPANVAKVVIMHVIAAPGSLQTDDFSLTQTTVAPPQTDGNLILNPSMETANGNSPANWHSNKWGQTTATFSYEPQGHTGGMSVKTKVTSYTDGDAKWYFDPVAVTAGKTYEFSDWYKSNVETRVVMAFVDANGNYSYQEKAPAPASSSWKQYSTSFEVPANIVKASVYHVVSQAGELTLDDASLKEGQGSTTPPQQEGIVPNASLEEAANATTPANWNKDHWGNNTTTFSYENQGRTGSKSVKVAISNYTDGDAKWYFQPVDTLQAGGQYRFETWYKTNVLPQVVAMYTFTDGHTEYLGLPSAEPSANSQTVWQKYSDTFNVPQNVATVSVFMFIKENGWLQTDDYNITPYNPTGFNRGLLTLTFDDGHEDNVTTALPLLQQYGFKTTQCYATSFIEGIPSAVQNVKTFHDAGHEICSHTVTHPQLTTLSDADVNYELSHSKQVLESIIGEPVRNFASPYGDYNAHVNDIIDNYYQAHRTVDEGYNSKDNFDQYRLRVQNIFSTTTAAQVRAWVEQAQADNTWLILVYHRVADDPETYDTYVDVFADQLEQIHQSGITVETFNQALNEVTTQL